MTATTTHRPGAGPRRADAGTVRLGQRDIDGLLLCAEHAAAPYDLLAGALGVTPARLRAIVARWRRAGYAATGRLGPGPAWCWLTPAGMPPPACATRPAARRWAGWRTCAPCWPPGSGSRPPPTGRPAGRGGNPNGGSAPTSAAGAAHRPDAEVHWPSLTASPHAGQIWAIEVELTPKPVARTTAIITALTAGPYARICYLTAPAARPVVTRAAAALPPGARAGHRLGPAPRRLHPRPRRPRRIGRAGVKNHQAHRRKGTR